MCKYCEKGKKIEEVENDNIYFWIYGKHLRVIGRVLNIPLGRDVIIDYCPMCRKEAGRVKFESKKKLREDIEKLEKEKKQLIEKRETNYDLYKAIIAIMLRENRKCIEIDFRDVLAADDYELAFYNNPFKTTKEIKLVRRTSNDK